MRILFILVIISLVLINVVFAQPQGMRGRQGRMPLGQERPQRGGSGQLQDLVLKNTIDINSLRLGHSFPNIIKRIPVIVDETTGNIYLAGTLTGSIYEVNPETGRILRCFDTGFSGYNPANLAVDSVLRTLYYMTSRGSVVSFDLGTGQKKGQYSYEKRMETPEEQEGRFPLRGNPRQGRGRFGEASMGTEPPQEDVPSGRRQGAKDGNIFSYILVDKGTNKLLVICRQESAIYVFDDRANLVKKILLQIAPIHMCWSDYLNSTIVAIGTKENPEMKFMQLNINEGTAKELLSLQRDIPERYFTVDEKGNYYLVGPSLSKIGPDGRNIWSVELQTLPSAVVYNAGVVAVLFKHGHAKKDEGGEVSCVDFYDCQNGAYLSTVSVSYEAQEMDVDKVHNRLLVGNGGDTSVSVVDWNNKKLVNTYRVGSAAEQVIYDKNTGDLYILNRLGGSEIYRYNLKTKRFDTIVAGGWPVRMALSSKRKRLYILSHYEAKVYVINPESFSVIEEIPLGIAGSKTDSISDMAFNDESGILVSGFPETANLVILNVDNKNVVKIKPSGTKPLPDEGPGNWQVQISKDGKNVLLYCDTDGKLIQYDISGNEIASIPASLMPKKTYKQEIFLCLPSTGELYLGPSLVKLNPLSIEAPQRFVYRVLDIKDGILYGNRFERDGQEILCLIDIDTGMPLAEYRMFITEVAHSNLYFDLETGIYFVTDMTDAKVYQYEIPAKR